MWLTVCLSAGRQQVHCSAMILQLAKRFEAQLSSSRKVEMWRSAKHLDDRALQKRMLNTWGCRVSFVRGIRLCSWEFARGHTWNGDLKRAVQVAKFAGFQNWMFVWNQRVDKSWILKFDAECNSENVCTVSDVHRCGQGHMNGYLHRHNCCICSQEGPQEIWEHMQDCAIFTVWCGLIQNFRIAADLSDWPGRRSWNFVSSTWCSTPLQSLGTKCPACRIS